MDNRAPENKTDRALLLEIHAMLAELQAAVGGLAARVDQLEAEFGPLARKYGKVVDAASRLPGVGMGRRSANGITPGYVGGARPRPK